MYEILMVNLEYGQLLNQYGDLSVEGEQRFNPQFALIEEAIIEKNRLLEKYIYAVIIIKKVGCGKAYNERYTNELGLKFLKEKNEYRAWRNLPFYKRIFRKQPVCVYYDGRH